MNHSRTLSSAICSALAAACLAVIGAGSTSAQTTYFWRSEATNGNWNDANNWWNGSTTQVPQGNEILSFDNNVQLSMTNNLANTSRFRINFLAGSGARVINGTTPNTFFDFGGQVPAIYNNSGNTQTLNFKIINGNGNGANRLELNANSGNIVIGADVSASGGSRTTVAMGSSNVTISGSLMEEAGATQNLRREGAGTLFLTGSAANTYSGTTTITDGTVAMGKTDGVNAVAGSGIEVNGSGSVLRWDANNQVADATPLTLSGGSLQLNAKSEGSSAAAGIGALTLTATSTIDFAAAQTSSILHFAGLGTHTSGADLLVTNWNGVPVTGGSGDRLLFTGEPIDFTSRYTQDDVYFNNVMGYRTFDYGSYYEVTAVPEPSTYLAGALALAAVAFAQRRRLKDLLPKRRAC